MYAHTHNRNMSKARSIFDMSDMADTTSAGNGDVSPSDSNAAPSRAPPALRNLFQV